MTAAPDQAGRPNPGAPAQAGMTSEQAAATGQAMLEAAMEQKAKIADGFLAQKAAVLDEVHRRMSEYDQPGPARNPDSPAGHGVQAGQGASQGAATQPGAQSDPTDNEMLLKILASTGTDHSALERSLIMAEIVKQVRAMIQREVRTQLAQAGIPGPRKKTP